MRITIRSSVAETVGPNGERRTDRTKTIRALPTRCLLVLWSTACWALMLGCRGPAPFVSQISMPANTLLSAADEITIEVTNPTEDSVAWVELAVVQCDSARGENPLHFKGRIHSWLLLETIQAGAAQKAIVRPNAEEVRQFPYFWAVTVLDSGTGSPPRKLRDVPRATPIADL